LFRRIRSRRGEQKAIMAVAHQLLTIIFHIIADGTVYQELGAAHYDLQHKPKVTRKLIERLTRLRYYVTVTPIDPLGPIPPPYQPEMPMSTLPPASPRRRGRPCQCAERRITCTHGLKEAQNNPRKFPIRGR
jgi:hypothetical protein